MSINRRRDPRTLVPDFIDWFEEPFLTLRPYLPQAIRVEEFTQDGRYVVRAEIAGIDPDKELEISASDRYLTIRAQRTATVEGTHRSEFRYGVFSRAIELPPEADTADVTAEYANGIVTISIGMKARGGARSLPSFRPCLSAACQRRRRRNGSHGTCGAILIRASTATLSCPRAQKSGPTAGANRASRGIATTCVVIMSRTVAFMAIPPS